MEAKEMFEKLGYEYKKDNDYIKYTLKKYISNSYNILFYLDEKLICCYISNDSPFSPDEPYEIGINELQAINKQIEELGWLEYGV